MFVASAFSLSLFFSPRETVSLCDRRFRSLRRGGFEDSFWEISGDFRRKGGKTVG
jgi:hypothetical protein